MTAAEVRAAAAWADGRGYQAQPLLDVADAMDRGEVVIPGDVSPKRPWSDVVLGLYAAGIDVVGLKEARAA